MEKTSKPTKTPITAHTVVALTWTLKDTLNEVLDELDEPVEFLIGGTDLLPKIEEALQEHFVGETIDLHLEPEHAFGDFDEGLIFLEPRQSFPKELEEGMTLDGAALPQGSNPDARRDVIYTIAQIYPEHVVLDGNHPLAGIALRLRVKIHAARPATLEEVGAGSCGVGFFKVEVAAGPQAAPGQHLH
jgi:FKBP-type peptidyl-prolyl cis-trans isomerase SlyD